jgi:hypothetical protein
MYRAAISARFKTLAHRVAPGGYLALAAWCFHSMSVSVRGSSLAGDLEVEAHVTCSTGGAGRTPRYRIT